MNYQSEISEYGDIDTSHPDGEFWAYRSTVDGPRGFSGEFNIITRRDMSDFSKSTYTSMGQTSRITKSWRVTVKNGRVRAVQ